MPLFLFAIVMMLILSAFLAFALAWLMWKNRSDPAIKAFSLLNVAACIWCLFNALETLTLDVSFAIYFASIEYIGIVSIPPLWLIFCILYTGRQKWLTPARMVIIWSTAILTLIACYTNSWHHLFWTQITLVETSLYKNLFFSYGPLFWGSVVIWYSMLLLGSIIMLSEALHYRWTFRRQIWLLLTGIAIPWITNTLFLSGVARLSGLDITPISMAISFGFIYWAISRRQLFDLVPFARERLMDVLVDGVMVIDQQQRVVEINRAACDLLRVQGGHIIGNSIVDAFENADNPLNMDEKIQIIRLNHEEDTTRYVQVQISPLYEEKNRFMGNMVVIQDVTERHMTDQMLKNRTEQLATIMDGTPAMMAYIDADLRYLYVNQSYADFIGRPREDFIGSYLRDVLKERDFANILPNLQKVLQGERVFYENWRQAARGENLLIYTTLSPHFSENGEVTSFYALLEDVTGIKAVESAERDQRALADALRRTVTALNSTMDFDSILEVILRTVGEVVPHDAANIALLDEQNVARIVRARGYEAYDCQEHILSFAVPLNRISNWQKVFDTHSPVFVNDTKKTADWVPAKETDWIRSIICAPIITQGKVIGFLNLDSEASDFFTAEHCTRLQTFADEAAVAIERARLFEEAKKRAEFLATVNRVALAITADLDRDTILRTLLEQIRQTVPVDSFYIALYDEQSKKMEIPLFYEDGMYRNSPPLGRKSAGLTGFVIDTKTSLHVPDLMDSDFELPMEYITQSQKRMRSYVGIPMIFKDHVVGAISMQNLLPNVYTSDQVHLLETIASQATIALENARLFDRMQTLAMTDTLTGIYNRRQFMSLGVQEFQRARRYNRNFSVIMIDIDHFKKVNDTYGHMVGDSVLQQIAVLIQRTLRSVDIPGRYGGEEFSIILPETSTEEAQRVAERLRILLEEKVMLVDNHSIRITASFGVASYARDDESLETLLNQADRALYTAKQVGRNQVKIYSPAMDE